MPKKPTNTIALINLGYIGDVINSSPVCLELKKAYPEAKLTYITLKSSYDTVKCLPGVDEVLIYDRRGGHKGLVKLIKLALSIRNREKFDLAILLTDSFRCAFFAYLLGAKRRIGRACQGRSFLLTDKIPLTDEEKKMQIHASEHYMRLLKPLNLYNQDYSLGFNYSKEDLTYIDEILKNSGYENKRLIGLCPCARLDGKNWWPDEAARFVDIINKTTDYKIVMVGDEYGIPFAEKIRENGITDFLDITGKTTISQLAALISKCDKFVSVDTGSMHLAFASRIPTVALFYYDCITKWGPKNLDINKVILNPDRHGISAKNVISELNQLGE